MLGEIYNGGDVDGREVCMVCGSHRADLPGRCADLAGSYGAHLFEFLPKTWAWDRSLYFGVTSMRSLTAHHVSHCSVDSGGQPYSIFGVLDTIKSLKPEVHTYGLGACYSYASLMLASGTKGKRHSMKNTRIMMSQPMGEVSAMPFQSGRAASTYRMCARLPLVRLTALYCHHRAFKTVFSAPCITHASPSNMCRRLPGRHVPGSKDGRGAECDLSGKGSDMITREGCLRQGMLQTMSVLRSFPFYNPCAHFMPMHPLFDPPMHPCVQAPT